MILRAQRARLPLVLALLAVIALAGWQIARYVRASTSLASLHSAILQRRTGLAERLLAEQLLSRPNDPQLHLLAARLARRRLDFKAADHELQQFLELGGDPADAGLEQGLAELQVGTTTHADEFFRVCTATPEAAETSLIAEALIEGALLRQDIASLEKYLSFWDGHFSTTADRAQSQLWRGKGLKLQRDLLGEKRAYERALELDSDNPQARLALVQRLIDEDPQAAAGHLAILRGALPDDAEVLFQSARLDRNSGRLENAQKQLAEVLKRQPRHVEALVLRGRMALEQQHPSEAAKDLLAAERLSPDHPAVLQARIDYLRLSGQEEECQRYRERFAAIRDNVDSGKMPTAD